MSDHVGSGAEGTAGLGSVVGTRNPVQNQKDLWSLQLHREFVAAVNKFGAMTNANPNLDGEELKSHLQKYCLYLEKSKEPQHPNMSAGVAFSSPSNLRSPNFTRQDTARHLRNSQDLRFASSSPSLRVAPRPSSFPKDNQQQSQLINDLNI
ncbi:hypothetical protein ACFX13_016663 [Malus domestica]